MEKKIKCTHHVCRCARARELLEMSDRARTPVEAGQLAAEAQMVHFQEVTCRIAETKGE